MYFSRFMIIVGVVILFISWVAYLHPEIFMKDERGRRWIRFVGEDWTRRVIRYVSVPLVALVCAVIIGRGILHEVMIWNAHRGNAAAQYELGEHFEHGDFQARDPAAAIRWYRRAAEKGHTLARVRLADMEARGVGWESR